MRGEAAGPTGQGRGAGHAKSAAEGAFRFILHLSLFSHFMRMNEVIDYLRRLVRRAMEAVISEGWGERAWAVVSDKAGGEAAWVRWSTNQSLLICAHRPQSPSSQIINME